MKDNVMMLGAFVDVQLIKNAKLAMENQLGHPISNAGMIRTLLGLMSENTTKVSVADVVEYSPETYGANKKSS